MSDFSLGTNDSVLDAVFRSNQNHRRTESIELETVASVPIDSVIDDHEAHCHDDVIENTEETWQSNSWRHVSCGD